jgi:tRNA-Thr(GGU) m(6)t(6)A37 methyltransferase TsaA
MQAGGPPAAGEGAERAGTDDCRDTGVSHRLPQTFSFSSIGHVGSANDDDVPPHTNQDESLIVLRPELAGGLDGIAPGRRLMVIFVFDRAAEYELRQHPRGDRRRSLRGVFALHSPRRPNPIGVTVVEVLEIAKDVVRVRGLDAWPGTPILDLKMEKKEGS